MVGEKKIVGLWSTASVSDRPQSETLQPEATISTPAPESSEAISPAHTAMPTSQSELHLTDAYEPAQPNRWPLISASALSLAWAGTATYLSTDAFASAPTLSTVPMLAAAISAPIAAGLLLYQFFQQNSHSGQNRFMRAAQQLRHENDALNASLASLSAHLSEARQQLSDQAQHLQKLGLDTIVRLDEQSEKLSQRAVTVSSATQAIESQSSRALQHMDGLLSGLPRIDDVAQRLASNFREAGLIAHQQGAQLEAQLAGLAEQSARSSGEAHAATAQLQDALNNLRCLSDDTQQGLISAAEKVAESQAATLSAMSRGTSTVQKDLLATTDQIASTMEQLWQKFRSDMDQAATDFDGVMARSQSSNDELASKLSARNVQGAEMADNLAAFVAGAQSQLANLDTALADSQSRVEQAIESTKGKLEGFAADVGSGNRSAQQLISHSDALLLALDSVTRELDETLPLAFQRLEAHEQSAQAAVSRLKPMIEASELVAQSTLSHIQAAEKTLQINEAQLSATADKQEGMISALHQAMESAQAALAQLNSQASHFAEQGSQNMLRSIEAVQASALQVAANAKKAFELLSEESREQLQTRAAEAVDEAFRAEMVTQLEAIELASHRAVAAANSAAERLSKQVTAINDASEVVESRTIEAEQAIAAVDRDTLAKQVGLLTEALKSTAIDMTKILSSEVSDMAWDAYLRGDRGIFARRAVKLIDHSEAREILRHYQNDNSFHASVNQFIHDFEAMLRLLMNARDGSAISVTLLSSDIGKLYVALAQAIDRLRN